MTYSAIAVANAFIQESFTNSLFRPTPTVLQQLMFIAHCISLKQTSSPILDDHFTVCLTGPTIPSIYHKLLAYAGKPIVQLISTLSNEDGYIRNIPTVPETDKDTWNLVRSVIKSYGFIDPVNLIHLTDTIDIDPNTVLTKDNLLKMSEKFSA